MLAETVIDAAAGWRSGHTATTICIQLGLLTVTGRASALGLRFISEHVCRETKRLKDELEAAEKRIAEQREYYEGVIADGSKRIAELEARTVTLPDRKSVIFWPGDADEFDSLGYVIAVRSAIRGAGIGVKGE
ncbi:ead/Ea22-like family protein [Salmonella enterica]|nr:ead/Ea22-like family protein [Salmonella enterica]